MANRVQQFRFLKERYHKLETISFPRKFLFPFIVVTILVFGLASAAIINGYNYFANKRVNIFNETKNDCPGISWIHPPDSLVHSYPVMVQGDLYFAGERVPLEDPDVRERLEREVLINVNWHSATILSMKMANRYFDEIEKILIANGVPSDFKYMALIESNFRLDASPAGAVGFWQMVKPTAKTYNLEVNDEVDERYNIDKSTLAACAYLKDAKEKFGNWTLAAASYNMGVPGMMARVKDQKSYDYYQMYFNPETERYVFRMLALKIIFANPKIAGYEVRPDELYQPYKYKTVEVDTPIANIGDFAAQFGLKYKHIKMLNPWLRDAHLANREHRKYEIEIMETD
jgi:membrane-bound lytic murein transglycosylase D